MIVAGVILIILSLVFPGVYHLVSIGGVIGWILVVLGVVFWLLGAVFHRPVGGRQFWW